MIVTIPNPVFFFFFSEMGMGSPGVTLPSQGHTDQRFIPQASGLKHPGSDLHPVAQEHPTSSNYLHMT